MKAIVKKIIAFCLTVLMLMGFFDVSILASAPYISGDEVILLAPDGHMARTEYKLENFNGDVVWSLDNAPAGVEIKPDGGLVVAGGSNGGTFEIVASDNGGGVIATTEVTVMDKLYNWADNSKRAYVDFEDQNVGASPSDRVIGNANWNDHVIRFGKGNRTNEPFAVVREEDGNKFISSVGTSSWYNNGSAFVADLISVNDDTKNAMINADTVTIEADFKSETDMLEAYNPKNIFWSVMTVVPNGRSDSVLDLRYKPTGDGNIEIHSFTDSAGVGNQDSSQAKITTLEADTWFRLRIELNIEHGTFDLYINNHKFLADQKHGMTDLSCKIYVGLAVDNIAAYTGKLLLARMPGISTDAIYLTDSRREAVLDLDTSVYLGDYAYENQVRYQGEEISTYKDKVFISDGTGDVYLQLDDDMFGMHDELVLSRESGLELKFDTDEDVGLSDGAEVSGGVLDATSGRALFDLKNSVGKMLLTFDASLASDVASMNLEISGGSENIKISFGEQTQEWNEVVLVIDTVKGCYTALYGGKLVVDGKFAPGPADSLTVTGMLADNLIYSSMNAVKPYVLSAVISGTKSVGQTLTAEYSYYSPWGASLESADIKWYVADEVDGNYTLVGAGESFKADSNHSDKYLRAEITANDGIFDSENFVSDSVYINDSYMIDISNNEFKMEISDCFDSRKVYAVASLYENNKLKKTEFENVDFESGIYTWSFDVTGYDGVSAMLVFADDFSVAADVKVIGDVPVSVQDEPDAEEGVYVCDSKLYISGIEDNASVFVYGHETDEDDLTVSFSRVYSRSEAWESTKNGNKIAFASVVNPGNSSKISLALPVFPAGSYVADIIYADGSSDSVVFAVNPELIITPDVMNTTGFKNVIRLYGESEVETADSLHSKYIDLESSSKKKVSELMIKSGIGLNGFGTATLLAAYFENDVSGGDEYESLCERLKLFSCNTAGIVLMQNDADKAVTGGVILGETWTSFESVMEICFEKAILYGIHHVRNFNEADIYLSALEDTKYPTSKYKSEICKDVAGKLYSSIEKLKNDIDAYKPSSSGGSSGGASGGASSKSGVSSSFGGAISVPPSEKPRMAQPYTDVSADHWADEAITYLSGRGIVNGFPDGSFAPDAQITRAEFTKIVCGAFGIPTGDSIEFSDVSSDVWYAGYVAGAAELGIVKGYNGMFMPDSFIKREDASLILFRILEKEVGFADDYGSDFSDYDDISLYARDAVMKLYEFGLVSGMSDGSFCPGQNMTRAQCAQLVANALRR